MNNQEDRTPDVLTDPATFATEVERALYSFTMMSATKEQVAFYKARSAFLTAHPQFASDSVNGVFTTLDEAVIALENAAFSKGVRIGAAAEYLRAAVVEPQTMCLICHGAGVSRHFSDVECRACNGQGSVPTRAL